MNFSDPILKIKRALRMADDAAAQGDYDEAIALMDSIREYALASQVALVLARNQRRALEVSTRGESANELPKAP